MVISLMGLVPRSGDIAVALPWALVGVMALHVAWSWRSALFIAMIVTIVALTRSDL